VKQSGTVIYKNNEILIKDLPERSQDLQVFVRPSDSIEFPVDLKGATYQIVGGDILLKLPSGGTITFVAMGLLAFTDNSVSINFPSYSIGIKDILFQIDEVKESPVEAVITDDFVKLNDEFSDTKETETAPENDNFSKILQEPTPLSDQEIYKKKDDEIAKPTEEVEKNDFNAVYKPSDDNPANVNISAVNNAVEAGLKFTLTAYQTPKNELKDGAGNIIEVDGGGGSIYGSLVDTPEAQFQAETLDYSKNTDGTDNTSAVIIHSNSPALFKTDPTDITSNSQLARDLSIKPEQPIGFGISAISISNLPDGFKIVGATYSNGFWEVPKAVYDGSGNLISDGFTVNINTGKARFTMTYPDDLLEGTEVTAVINFTSSFNTANLLPGENVDTPDVLSLLGQGRLNFVTKEIDWESPTGYEDFIDEDKRVVLATNPNNDIVFTSHGDSTVYGGDGQDTITAYEGNDTLNGALGNDTLNGGTGDDTINGDDGDDTLIGQSGTNLLDGGDGSDTVDYTFVTDSGGVNINLSTNSGLSAGVTDTIQNVQRVLGSSEDDIITGNNLANILEGAEGIDTLTGLDGADTLLGGAGNDVLDGSLGNDTLNGESGNDTLDGGAGNDKVYGEAGNDTFLHDAGDDTLDGGLGSDTMDFTGFAGGVVASIYQGDVTIANNDGNDVISNMEILNGSADNDQLTGGSDDNTLFGQAGDDTLRGNEGNDLLRGGDGVDTLKGGADIDTLEGGAGDDLLLGEAGADKLDGGADIDTANYSDEGAITTTLNGASYAGVSVSGGDSDQIKNIENIQGSNTGNDSIKGDTFTNILDGQGGSDTLDGGAGIDTVLGGAGDDTLRGGAGDDDLQGGTGSDTADYQGESGIVVDLLDSGASSVNISNGDTDTILDIENITGSNTANDTITGNIADNVLKGLSGNDTLTGDAGDDYLDGGNDNDTLYGGADQDTLKGSYGDDYLEGGSGNDIIDGGVGIDSTSYAGAINAVNVRLDTGIVTGDGVDSILNIENVVGSAFADTIVGNNSINVLIGGDGDDTILSGLGDDIVYGEAGADTLSGGEGIDRLYGEDATNADTSSQDMASFNDVDSGVGINVNLTNDNSNSSNAKVLNDGFNSVDYLYDIENIRGTDYKDSIVGDTNNNYLLGEAEQDTIYGGLGNDTLDGGAQDDTLRGDAGYDTLIGGDGLDSADYTNATNAIKVDLASYDGSGFNVSEDGEGTKDRLVGVENIIGTDIVGESDTIIGDTTNNVLSGLSGDDTLKGGSGLDTLDGGEGNDTLFGGADADTLTGGAGVHDIVDFSDVTANGVSVNLTTGVATGDGDDKLFTIEDIRGSNLADALSGNSGVNTIYGGDGADVLEGGSKVLNSTDTDLLYGEDGDDTLRGDAGDDILFGGDVTTDTSTSDTADYSTVTNLTNTGIDADLSRIETLGDRNTYKIQEDGYGTKDSLEGIENISGTVYNDLIKGSDTVSELNVLSGNDGVDSFIVSDGKDSIVGGAGKDTVNYNSIVNAVNTGIVLDFDVLGEEKSITKTTNSGTYIDLVKTVETVIGTDYADSFTGGSGDDEFYGRDGNDNFLGNTGVDTLVGEDGDDTIDGGSGNDDLKGGIGDDTLIGGAGDDLMDGGTNLEDRDVADYTDAATKIALSGNNVIGSDTGTDTLSNIEVILATNYEDTLVGDIGKNVLDGRGANDTILGQGGEDTLIGFSGGDTINGGTGSDLLIGGSDTNDKDTVGFNEVVVNESAVSDVTNIVSVDLDSGSASSISITRTDTTAASTYSFDIGSTTISYSAVNGDTGDFVISKLYDSMASAGITDIKQINDISNTASDDVYNTSHRLLIMDTSAGQTGFSIANVTNVTHTLAGTASDGTDIDYLFDFDNIVGSDFNGAGVGDTLTGNSTDNKIHAGEGNDTIFSTLGADYLDGEEGSDWVDYSNQATTRVDVQLDAGNGDGTGLDNFANTLINIENIRGTDAVIGDTIVGDDNVNIIEGGDNNNNADTNANYEILSGGAGNDTIYGDGGRDIIYGGADNDTLYGGDASDRHYGGSGADIYIGGAGYDYVYYNGDDGTNTAVSINLTTNVVDAHGDIANGTDIYQEIEYIYGSDGGADTFRGDVNDATRVIAFNGLNGADTIIGGAGNENLIGEDGDDLLTGGDGNDVLSGQNNNDTFFSSRGIDTISGGAGKDTIDFRVLVDNPASIGTDITNGVNVNLTPTVNIGGTDYGTIVDNGFGENGYILGVENLEATNFDDIFTGDASKNIVNLYGGDDTLFISDGGDTVDGGTNNLLVSGSLNGTKDTWTDGSGGDWIDGSLGTTGSIFLNSFDNIGSPTGYNSGFEHIKGSDSPNTLKADNQDNSIIALDGDDTLLGLGGNDYLDGGLGNDVATYGGYIGSGESPTGITVHYDDVVKNVDDGFGDTDVLFSIETIEGSSHNDTFFGSDGVDTFLSGGGQDSFVTSLGDDYLSGNEGGVSASLVDYSSTAGSNKLILDLSAGSDEAKVVATADGAKLFTDQLQSVKNVIATNENDTITGDTADNSLYGLDGDDTFIATNGNDTYDGGASVVGDWVDYSGSATTIISNLKVGSTSKGIGGSNDGLNAIEHIETGSANDIITASNVDNTIIANAGNDTIYSNDGNNVFYGDDNTNITTNDGASDTIRYDLEDSGLGVKVNISDIDFGTITQNSAKNAYGKVDVLYNFENIIGSANGDTLVGNDLSNSISGGAGDDEVQAGAGDDSLLGSTGDDTIYGGDGIDSIFGGDDNDEIYGENADDYIEGGTGNDTIDGGAGDDRLFGEGGYDTFKDSLGIDTINAGSGDDIIKFTTANFDATAGNDTIIGGDNSDTLEFLDAITTGNLQDADFANVTEVETIKFSATSGNDITLDKNAILLQGSTGVDTFHYTSANFTNADSINGGNGVDELILSGTVTKTLSDLANVTSVEKLTTTTGDDNIDVTGGTNTFTTITLGDGDDNLTIDSLAAWSGKILDGGNNTGLGDTLKVDGTQGIVDLSVVGITNFENIEGSTTLTMSVEQANNFTSIDATGNTLAIKGNGNGTQDTLDAGASHIIADKISFSGLTATTTLSHIYTDIDASGSSSSLVMGIDALTDKTALEIKGSSGGSDVLNVVLGVAEAIPNGFKVDNAVETFNLTVTDNNHALDLTNILTTTTLKTAGSVGTNTITIDNATKDIDGSNLNTNETLLVNATSSTNDITGGASVSDKIVLGAGDTFGVISGVEIIDVQENNNLSGKLNDGVSNINITAGKTLTLIASDLSANTIAIDNGNTTFTAGTVGNNNYSNISLTSAAELVMKVSNNLDISSQGSDDIKVLTQLNIANARTFTFNADQSNNDLDIVGATTSANIVIKSTTTDANNDFTSITNNGSGTITYSVVNNVDKTSEASNILGDIDTLDIASGYTLQIDNAQLANITTLNGTGTLDLVGDGSVDLSALLGSFTGDILISDVAAVETITASKFNDTITIDAGAGDSVDAGAGEDKINLSQNITVIDGGTGTTDEIVLKASGLDLSSTTIVGIETITFNAGGVSNVTMNSTDVNSIAIAGDANTNTINIADTGTIDLSSATLTSIEAIVFNDSSANTITANLDGANLLLGDSSDTLKINATDLSSADTITGGSGTDTIEFLNGGTVADSAFTNISGIETIKFSNNATDFTLGTQAGAIATLTGGLNTSDTLTLTGAGSYTNISAIETLNIDKTIDLSGKITDVETINVLATKGMLTLDADDFTTTIAINNDNTLTINDAKTATISNLDLTGSVGNTTINLTAGGTTIDFSLVTFSGNVSMVGSTGNDVITVDEGVALINGNSGTNELIIKAGSSDTFANKSIINIETISVNESVSLVGTIDDDVIASINVAATKTLTLSAVDLSAKTIDLVGTGDTTFSAGMGADTNDYNNISVSGGANLTMNMSSSLDISASGSDNLAALTHLTLASGVTLTLNASQSDNALNITGSSTTSDVIIETTITDTANDFTNFVNSGSGNIILDVVVNVDKSGESATILGVVNSVIIEAGKTLTLDANQITNLSTLDGTGTLNVNALGGVTDLSGLVNGAFTGTINIFNSTSVDTITGSKFDDNIVYSSVAQNDVLNGGLGADKIVVSGDADLSALAGANVTNISELEVSGNFTAIIDKDFTDNSSVTTYTGSTGITDFVKVALADGEDIDMSTKTMSELKLQIDVSVGGAGSTIVGNDSVVNIVTVVEGTNLITLGGQNDTVTGGTGADTITIGNGSDVVNAGAGNDIIKVSTASLTFSDTLDGGTDNNTLEFTNASGAINHADFANVTNIQTLKLADGDNTIDFSTNAGSISKVDGSGMTTSTSNLDITTGSQLTNITGGTESDIIRYTDANLSIADILDGSGGVDTLLVSDGATIIASDLSNVSNIEVLQLSNNTNIVDLTNSTIDSIIGGSASDTITAQGDEVSISTSTGDDNVYITSVPTGLIDGGADGNDTLYVTGDLDLSSANIINFENIVASGDLTLSVAQASGITMAIASGKTLTIKDISATGSLNATNITGGQINIASLTAALIVTGLATKLDANIINQDLTVQTADGSLDIAGSTGTSTTAVAYTTNTTLSGTLTNIETITANSGLTVDATLLNGKTQVFITTDTITINATATSTDHDFAGITQTGSGNVLLNVDSIVDLSTKDITVVNNFDVAAGKTLTLEASQLSGKATTATGTYTLNNLQSITTADFNNVDAGATLNVFWSGIDTYTGNLDNVDSLTISSGAMSASGTIIDGKTISGAGTLTITDSGDSILDVANIITTPALDVNITDTATTLNGITIDVDASGSTQNITYNMTDVDGKTITTGSGTNSINANALSDGNVVNVLGDDDVTVTLVAGDVDASASTGNISVTATTGSNIIKTGSGDDIINSGDGDDTVFGSTFTTTRDTVNMEAGTNDVLDFSNIGTGISATEASTPLAGSGTVSGTDINIDFTGVEKVIGSTQDDSYTVDFANIGNLVFDGNSDVTAAGDKVTLTGSVDVTGDSSFVGGSDLLNIESLDISALTLINQDTTNLNDGNELVFSTTDITNMTDAANSLTLNILDDIQGNGLAFTNGTTTYTDLSVTGGDGAGNYDIDGIALHVV